MAENWSCPYCNKPQIISRANQDTIDGTFDTVQSSLGKLGLRGKLIVCLNTECLRPTISIKLMGVGKGQYGPITTAPIHLTKQILPESLAKPQPEFIPHALREDYHEACLIRDLSPKSSATLSRRCLQGMIHDFCGVADGSLAKEIDKVRTMVAEGKAPQGVSPESIDAIDHVRSVGNIGAHMEKNIDHIVPVEPQEAQMLIELIETLFEDWYVARDTRARRFANVKAVADDKRAKIAALKVPQIEGPKED